MTNILSPRTVVTELAALLQAHGLQPEDLVSLARKLVKSGEHRAPPTGELNAILEHGLQVLKDPNKPIDNKIFSQFCLLAEAVLDCPIDRRPLLGWGHKARRWLRKLSAFLLFALTSYFVVGAIYEGHSAMELAARAPLSGLALLGLLMIVVAALEGSQIAVVELKNTDAQAFSRLYKRAAATHRQGYRESDVQQYLAGRQFMVIMIVFFISRITAFPNIKNFPLTDIPLSAASLWLPASFQAVVYFALMTAGLLGALFVLWFAQLMPQFIANRNAYWFAELPGMPTLVKLCKAVERIGITDPGNWLSNAVPAAPRFPLSTREQHRNDLAQRGFAAQGIQKSWIIDRSVVKSVEQDTWAFSSEVSRISHSAHFGFANNPRPEVTARLIRSGADLQVDCSVEEGQDDETGTRMLLLMLTPHQGNFMPGDVLSATIAVQYDLREGGRFADLVLVEMPMKYLNFSLQIADNIPLNDPSYVVRRFDVSSNAWFETEQGTLAHHRHFAGSAAYEYSGLHPSRGARFEFRWQIGS